MQPFADVQKTFGLQGELIIKLWSNAPGAITITEPVFVIMDGLPVPFYFKSFELRGGNRALVIFEDFEEQRLAEELVGKKLLLPVSGNSSVQKRQDDLAGYIVCDKQQGELGAVTGFLDIPGNPCLQINFKGRELIIPYHNDIVKKINSSKHILQVELPEGLIDL